MSDFDKAVWSAFGLGIILGSTFVFALWLTVSILA
jgi:hypothetical protein